MNAFVPLLVLPYLLVADFHFLLASGKLDALPEPLETGIVVLVLALNAAELFFCIRCLVRALKTVRGGDGGALLVRKAAAVKLLHIPAYLYFFCVGCIMLLFPHMGFVITLLCFLSDLWSISLTGLLMAIALYGAYRRRNVSLRQTVLHGILSFIFCADVIDALYLRLKVFRAPQKGSAGA